MDLCLFLYPEMFVLANLSVPFCFISECVLGLLVTPQIQLNFWCKSRTFKKINKQNQTCLLWQWILSLWYANFCWTLGRVLMKLNPVVLLFPTAVLLTSSGHFSYFCEVCRVIHSACLKDNSPHCSKSLRVKIRLIHMLKTFKKFRCMVAFIFFLSSLNIYFLE